LCRSKYGALIRSVNSLDPVRAGPYLHFKASTTMGAPFDSSIYRVEWRVTNTDEAAANERCLRGGFEKPESDNSRWEWLKYRGIHLVEAFVIQKRDEVLVGKSEPFRVMIE
jgi:hypothetical protein